MRKITDHKIPGTLNGDLEIQATSPGAGGMSNLYAVYIPDSVPLPAGVTIHQHISFQSRAISGPQDYNGLTNEALAAIIIDRLRGAQYKRNPDGSYDFASRGEFACRENACSLTHFEEGLMWLQKRTRDRQAAGIEGKHVATAPAQVEASAVSGV